MVLGEDNKPQKYAVKLFRDYHLNQYPAIANEVFGAVLAEQFDLQTPPLAFVEFLPEFIETLAPPQRAQLAAGPPGPKIGSAFLDGCFDYSPALHGGALEPYDLATVYGFDNLILNVDRRVGKPNLLFRAHQPYLIDHEMSLSVAPTRIQQLREQRWEHDCTKHVFHPYLRRQSAHQISRAFHTFGQYLRGLNPAKLAPYQHQLTHWRYAHPDFETLLRYLSYQKAHASQFEELLKRTLL